MSTTIIAIRTKPRGLVLSHRPRRARWSRVVRIHRKTRRYSGALLFVFARVHARLVVSIICVRASSRRKANNGTPPRFNRADLTGDSRGVISSSKILLATRRGRKKKRNNETERKNRAALSEYRETTVSSFLFECLYCTVRLMAAVPVSYANIELPFIKKDNLASRKFCFIV